MSDPDSPESVSSRMQAKYVNFEYSMIFISLYWKFKGLGFFNPTFTAKNNWLNFIFSEMDV